MDDMENFIQKADVLIEALPYIQAFKGQKIVIKLGGSLMSSETAMKNVLQDIVFMQQVGWRSIIVHGGGPAISTAMKDRAIIPRFLHGQRVTNAETMDLVEDFLANKINSQIVNLLNDMKGDAYGLSGLSQNLIKVDKMVPMLDGKKCDIGYVGKVRYINASVINNLLAEGKIPVIAPIGIGDDGSSYNVNGDIAAGDIASSVGARKLVYLTDTPGILQDSMDDKSLISALTQAEAVDLIESGVIAGGMIPKVNSCLNALTFGVKKGHIVDGCLSHSLLLEIFTNKGVGTEIIKNET